MSALTIACVLRRGPLYTGAWVERLRRNVARHAPPHRFVCLSDVELPPSCERIPLSHGWPGWWSIVEVFRPRLFDGRVVYFDLANLIIDAIDPIAAGDGFRIALSPPSPPTLHGRFASGAMAFDAGDSEIYDRFAGDAPGIISRLHGDQEWIEELRPAAATIPRELTLSYKGDCLALSEPPASAAVIFFHGRPKPTQIPAAHWARGLWADDAEGLEL